jgi:hypothetical protein
MSNFLYWLDLTFIALGIGAGLLGPRPDVYSGRFIAALLISVGLIVAVHVPSANWIRVDCGHDYFNLLLPCYRRVYGLRGRNPHLAGVLGFAGFFCCIAFLLRHILSSAFKSDKDRDKRS